MAADSQGNDLSAVGIPLTGFAAVQLDGEPEFLESVEGGGATVALPAGYEKLGLFKDDGGPQDATETEDAIEFFQDGYKIAGASTLTVAITLAEFNAIVRRLISGKTPDENGMILVDQAAPDATFPFFTVTTYKTGIQVRRNGLARVQAVEPDQDTRGEVKGRATTFEWVYQEAWMGYYREWVYNPIEQGS